MTVQITIAPYVISDEIRTGLDISTDDYETFVWTGFVFEFAGTLLAGVVLDKADPRMCYLVANYGVAFVAVLMSYSQHMWQFTAGWYCIAAWQCGTWAAVVKVVSNWFPHHMQGRAMALGSFSFLVGDLVARASVGFMLRQGFGWQHVMKICAAMTAIGNLPSAVWLRSSPADVGLATPQTTSHAQDNLLGDVFEPSVFLVMRRLFGSSKFWLVLLLNFITCGHREFWLTHSALFLQHAFCVQREATLCTGSAIASKAAFGSAIFSLSGVCSSWVAGTIKDYCGVHERGRVLVIASASYAAVLILACHASGALSHVTYTATILCMAGLSFSMYFLYNYLNSFALDFGGKTAATTTNGITMSVGFGGATGFMILHEHLSSTWHLTFQVHFASSLLLLGVSAMLWYLDQYYNERIRSEYQYE